ncbi:hypothetical protein A2Z33_04780 [Candidatus Gottesmanbacteria bacterium RBG_16_52_11]|uniref:DUF2079 domain-containing protein n=1 Tax=Candidatus Gottesmanbacteria bacterium RBG_16_52_11 TaxID=1798374 RepID=A0A1F5YUL4_9BACT|nr:MAG: hypothetical protein A2Z33_04780 [Candidatus Gottesmanbacteria bacterium RBG_16_52_11]
MYNVKMTGPRKSDLKTLISRIFIVYLIALTVLYSALSVVRHNHFQSGGFDLGLYDQSVWQYSRLLWPYNTIKQRFILGDHLSLTLPLIAPLYRIWDDVRMLLIFQAFFVTFSAYPVYLLGLKKKLSHPVAIAVAVAYSLFYGIQYLIFFDFHPVAIGVGLIPWILYFLESGRHKAALVCIILLVLSVENMGLALAGIGCLYLFRKDTVKKALIFICGGILASLLASRVTAFFSPVGYEYLPQVVLNPLVMLSRFLDNPEKRQVWLFTVTSFGGLAIFSPGAMLAVLIDLAQYFLTGPVFSRMWSPFMHHRAILAPFLAYGAIDAAVFLSKKRIPFGITGGYLIVAMLFTQYFFHFPLNKLAKSEYWKEEAWMNDLRQLVLSVPANASVAAQQNLVPHLSHRREIYLVYPRMHSFENQPCGRTACWWLDFGGKPDFLTIDTRPNQWLTQTLESDENWRAAVTIMERTGFIIPESSFGDARLYQIIYSQMPI